MVGTTGRDVATATTVSGIASAVLIWVAIGIVLIACWKCFVRDRSLEALLLTGAAMVLGGFAFVISDDPHWAPYVVPLLACGMGVMLLVSIMQACLNWPQSHGKHRAIRERTKNESATD